MYALLLHHLARVGSTPVGILVVHETNEPVLVGETALSQSLANAYCKGLRVTLYDAKARKHKEFVVPPKDVNKFLDIGSSYYSFASMTLQKVTYVENESRTIEVAGTSFSLKEFKNG